MPTHLTACYLIRWPSLFLAVVLAGFAIRGSADELRVMVERTRIAGGVVADVIQRADGAIVVSGDYWPRVPGQDGIGHIAVVTSTGRVLQRLSSPNISASATPVYLRWRVRAVLADGSYVVDDASGFGWERLLLANDGTPIRPSGMATGPVAVQKNGGALFGRGPRDEAPRAAIERWRFSGSSLERDYEFASNA